MRISRNPTAGMADKQKIAITAQLIAGIDDNRFRQRVSEPLAAAMLMPSLCKPPSLGPKLEIMAPLPAQKTPDALRRGWHFCWLAQGARSAPRRLRGFNPEFEALPDTDGERLAQTVEFGQRRHIGFVTARNRIERVLFLTS